MDKYNGKEDTFEAFNNKNKAINQFENTGNEDNLFYKSFNHFPLFTGVKVNNNYSNEAFSDNDEEMAFSKNNDIEDNTSENQNHEKPIHQQV